MSTENSNKGVIQEIFSSFQGEGAALTGSCYGLRQIFVRFAGCPLALGAYGTAGCIWCDSPQAQREKVKICKVEDQPGNQSFIQLQNPLSAIQILEIIKSLKTSDLHSISLTGGDPLYQPKLLRELISLLKQEGFHTYLETAFTDDLDFLEAIANEIDYACVDIKDRSAQASLKWEELVETEVRMCKILKDAGVQVFAKVVISQHSKSEDFHFISEQCGKFGIPLAIQPVTPRNNIDLLPPTWKQIKEFTEIAGTYLPPKKIGISVQVHKLINIL
ncbi:MAG: 7-carboxy-7-deazaguanine synthase QueE [Candidatus Heimdallarchaeaceae archaeon]